MKICANHQENVGVRCQTKHMNCNSRLIYYTWNILLYNVCIYKFMCFKYVKLCIFHRATHKLSWEDRRAATGRQHHLTFQTVTVSWQAHSYMYICICIVICTCIYTFYILWQYLGVFVVHILCTLYTCVIWSNRRKEY